MFKKQVLLSLLVMSMLSGCSQLLRPTELSDDDLVEVSYGAVEDLLHNLKQPLPRGSLVVVNSLVNVDDLGQNMAFGRIVSDQLTSAIHRSGYRVQGLELPTEIFSKNEAGILQLPDPTKQALNDIHANALVFGSFAAGRHNVYVSLRVVELSTQNIISSTDFSVPMGPDARTLTTVRPQPAAK